MLHCGRQNRSENVTNVTFSLQRSLIEFLSVHKTENSALDSIYSVPTLIALHRDSVIFNVEMKMVEIGRF